MCACVCLCLRVCARVCAWLRVYVIIENEHPFQDFRYLIS